MKTLVALLLLVGCQTTPSDIDDNATCPVVPSAVVSVTVPTQQACSDGATEAVWKYAQKAVDVASGQNVSGCRLIQRESAPEDSCVKIVEVECGEVSVFVELNPDRMEGELYFREGCSVFFKALID